MLVLDSNFEKTEKKIIILYFIDKLKLPISNLQITKVFLENGFINYFLLQQYLAQLTINEYVFEAVNDGFTFYSITEKGKEILKLFIDYLSLGIKKRKDDEISLIRNNVRKETSITANYEPEGHSSYKVNCKICEDDFTLISINLAVGSKEDAQNICKKWNSNSQVIYNKILNALIDD